MDLRMLLPDVPFQQDHNGAIGQQKMPATMPNG
jgi:hypothetical protein